MNINIFFCFSIVLGSVPDQSNGRTESPSLPLSVTTGASESKPVEVAIPRFYHSYIYK